MSKGAALETWRDKIRFMLAASGLGLFFLVAYHGYENAARERALAGKLCAQMERGERQAEFMKSLLKSANTTFTEPAGGLEHRAWLRWQCKGRVMADILAQVEAMDKTR